MNAVSRPSSEEKFFSSLQDINKELTNLKHDYENNGKVSNEAVNKLLSMVKHCTQSIQDKKVSFHIEGNYEKVQSSVKEFLQVKQQLLSTLVPPIPSRLDKSTQERIIGLQATLFTNIEDALEELATQLSDSQLRKREWKVESKRVNKIGEGKQADN